MLSGRAGASACSSLATEQLSRSAAAVVLLSVQLSVTRGQRAVQAFLGQDAEENHRFNSSRRSLAHEFVLPRVCLTFLCAAEKARARRLFWWWKRWAA